MRSSWYGQPNRCCAWSRGPLRLKSEIWVSAHMRLAVTNGAMATVIDKGDIDACAIYIQTLDGKGEARLYGPTHSPNHWPNHGANQSNANEDLTERYWRLLIHHEDKEPPFAENPNPIDDYLSRQRRFDPDIWVIEIEDREGRHFLGANLLEGLD